VINTVREELNVDLSILGVLLTMFDKRTRLSQDVAKKVRATFKDLIFDTIINQRIKLAEGAMQGLPITAYAASSDGAEEYRSLARELLKRESQT
jgi:chromosome partitioning protein